MLNSLILYFLTMAVQIPALTQQVKLAWDPVPEATEYRVYYHAAGAPYALAGTTTETTFTVSGLSPGAYSFVVTAFNATNESPYSNEVVTILLPPGPRIEGIGIYNITQTTAYVAWSTSEECSGYVMIGTTASLGRTVAANNLGTTDHAVIVGLLIPRTHYFYRVVSVCNGVTVQSGIRTVNTK